MTVRIIHRGPAVPKPIARPAPRSRFARAALFAGGSATGLAASALAGFGLVGLLFPNSGLPGTGGAAISAAAYMHAPASAVPTVQIAHLTPAPTPTPAAVPAAVSVPVPSPATTARPSVTRPSVARRPASVTATATAPLAPPLAPRDSTRPAADEAALAAPETTPEAHPVDIDSTYGVRFVSLTTTEDLPAAAFDPARFGPRVALVPEDRPEGREEITPPPAEPPVFAALSAGDARPPEGASLFARPEAPQDGSRNRPQTAPEAAAVETATAEAAGEALAARPMRPLRRPEGFADRVAAAVPAPGPATAPATKTATGFETATAEAPRRSMRPNRRPAHMDRIVLASASRAAPATAVPPAPAPEVTAPSGIVEVSARRSKSGLFGGGKGGCGRSLTRAMPSRRGGATGSAFFADLIKVSGPDRDAKAIAELARGNMPGFMHKLQPVTFRGQDKHGQPTEITICVTPDYLALGSDTDFVRVPLGLPAAARIAGAFDMTLPTPRMVDAIYAQAGVKLSPAPMTPGAQMSSTNYFLTHNATIEGQLQGRRGLTAGHKKDVVMASRMASAPGQVAIYGWHQSNGVPIQPVSTVHGANYADYSHGIRLVSKTAYLNGRAVALAELLASSRYAHLLNKEGPMPGPVIRIASN